MNHCPQAVPPGYAAGTSATAEALQGEDDLLKLMDLRVATVKWFPGTQYGAAVDAHHREGNSDSKSPGWGIGIPFVANLL